MRSKTHLFDWLLRVKRESAGAVAALDMVVLLDADRQAVQRAPVIDRQGVPLPRPLLGLLQELLVIHQG